MRKEYRNLLRYVESIHPLRLLQRMEENGGAIEVLSRSFPDLFEEYLDCYLTDMVGSPGHAHTGLAYLNMLMEKTLGYGSRLKRLWKDHPLAMDIRRLYSHTAEGIQRLTLTCGRFAPGALEGIPLVGPQLTEAMAKMAERHRVLAPKLGKGMAGLLLEELYLHIRRRKRQGLLSRGAVANANRLMDELEAGQSIDGGGISALMQKYGFSSPALVDRFLSQWQAMLLERDDLWSQMELLVLLRDGLLTQTATGGHLSGSGDTPYDNLLRFIEGKEETVSRLLRLRAEMAGKDGGSPPQLRIALPVAQLALLIRAFMENGLLQKDSIGETFFFFATYFQTPQTRNISADSLRKKSTDVEFATANKLKGHLIAMVNWLNANYNLSNFTT